MDMDYIGPVACVEVACGYCDGNHELIECEGMRRYTDYILTQHGIGGKDA